MYKGDFHTHTHTPYSEVVESQVESTVKDAGLNEQLRKDLGAVLPLADMRSIKIKGKKDSIRESKDPIQPMLSKSCCCTIF